VTNGQEIVANSDAQVQSFDGKLGCVSAGGRTEGTLKIEFQLCLCNSTLCNVRNSSTTMFPSIYSIVVGVFLLAFAY